MYRQNDKYFNVCTLEYLSSSIMDSFDDPVTVRYIQVFNNLSSNLRMVKFYNVYTIYNTFTSIISRATTT